MSVLLLVVGCSVLVLGAPLSYPTVTCPDCNCAQQKILNTLNAINPTVQPWSRDVTYYNASTYVCRSGTTTSTCAAQNQSLSCRSLNRECACTTPAQGSCSAYSADCTGFGAYVLRYGMGPENNITYIDTIQKWLGTSKVAPNATGTAAYFSQNPTPNPAIWSSLSSVLSVKPGDLLTWGYPNVIPGSATGHFVWAYGYPQPAGSKYPNVVSILVFDSTSTFHGPNDTRANCTNNCGVGIGTMYFGYDPVSGALNCSRIYWSNPRFAPEVVAACGIGSAQCLHSTAAPTAAPTTAESSLSLSPTTSTTSRAPTSPGSTSTSAPTTASPTTSAPITTGSTTTSAPVSTSRTTSPKASSAQPTMTSAVTFTVSLLFSAYFIH